MNKINIATFNIGGGVPYKYSIEYKNREFNPVDYISNIILENNLDIIFFQEVLMSDNRFTSMSHEISTKSGLKYYKELSLSDSHIVKGRKMGVSIISRFPIIESEVFMLENPNITKISNSGSIYKSHEKGFLITKVQNTSIGEICCVTGHCFPFHSFDRDIMDFKYIYERLERKLLSLTDENSSVIIGADFNTTRLNLLMPIVFEHYNSLVNIPTRPNNRMDDYLFCNKTFKYTDFRLIKTCFDHYACMGIIGLNNN